MFPPDSHAKGGNLRQESLGTVPDLSFVSSLEFNLHQDDIYEQSMALMSCCKELAPLLEGIKVRHNHGLRHYN